MPHSSGGGSHGGGSHGGHSHGGRGGSGGNRISKTRFVGSRRYSYYDKHGMKQYIYCREDPAKTCKPRWFLLIFYIPFLFGIGSMFLNIVHVPQKVVNHDSVIVIEDYAGLIQNESYLRTELANFYDATGVTPAVVTVYHSVWINNYSDMEKFAYDLYVNMFSDEKHWLIVYSVPDNYKDLVFVDWRWEGMIGDHVSSMITTRHENMLTREMQRNFTASSKYNLEQAIALSFGKVADSAQQVTLQFELIPIALFMTAFVVLHAVLMTGLTPNNLRYSKAVYDPDPRELPITCTYCSSTFILGDHTGCPNCGAPLEVNMQTQQMPQTQQAAYPNMYQNNYQNTYNNTPRQ